MTAFPLPTARLLALVAVALASPAHGEVWVVDVQARPGYDTTTIQAAIDLAADGDLVLVRDGTYANTTVRAKSLALVADGPGVVIDAPFASVGYLTVRDLAAGQRVLASGFVVGGTVVVADCAGPVWLDRIASVSTPQECGDGLAGISVSGSAAVTVTRCDLLGTSGSFWAFAPVPVGPGASVGAGSSARFFDCVLRGSAGQSPSAANNLAYPGVGGAGLQVAGSTVLLSGCTLLGGPGGVETSAVCNGMHARGGAGLFLVDASALVQSVESTATGGAAQLSALCTNATGPAGPAIEGPGIVLPLYGYARHLVADGPVRGGSTLTLTVGGRPGEEPLLLVSDAPQPLTLLQHSGALLVSLPPVEMFALAALPASGQRALVLPVPNVGALPGAVTLYAQPVFFDRGGSSPTVWLGAGAPLVLLDPTF